MPVMLAPIAFSDWLDPANHDVAALQKLLRPALAASMIAYRVGLAVNQSRCQGTELIEPAREEETRAP